MTTHKAAEGMISLEEAESRLGVPIDLGTIPEKDVLSLAGRYIVMKRKPREWDFPADWMGGERKPCKKCGDEHNCRKCLSERSRLYGAVRKGLEAVPTSALIQCAAVVFEMSDSDICLLLPVTMKDIAVARQAQAWPKRDESQRRRAEYVVALLRQRLQYETVAHRDGKEIKIGKLNKWRKLPPGVVVVSRPEYDLLVLLARGYTIPEAARTMGASLTQAHNHRRYLFTKFKVDSDEQLLQAAKEHGLKAEAK